MSDPMSPPNLSPSTPSAATTATTSGRPSEPLWRVRFTATPRRPDAYVTAAELDAYYRRSDVFEITAHTQRNTA
jgi:hypothetical protein